MAISDWPADEQPREKLLFKGPSTLSDAELLAIFLRTGCAGKSAVDLARELLSSFGSLRRLLESDQASFCSRHGLGKAKYAQLQAVLEMSRRHLEEHLDRPYTFENSQRVKSFLRAKLRHHLSEVFAALFLDSQHRLIAYEELSHGTIDSASIYPREVIKGALKHNSAAVIFAHNHPSGVAEPSEADKAITKRLKMALDLVDIHTLDHFVVGDNDIVSLAELGFLR